ncbi:cytochrome c oxidase subunit 7B2, mitochondrial [Nannospalax galili]|uniref:cytochrome c oxidase subunit 7B2, mitochondrial n=1 Tax=Nannospalax galili TaxID=1026970 RepID=UPI0004ED5031|nr:cytochrome c oxidase subunit 7B2, mitochondrial [Nannospalax galili]
MFPLARYVLNSLKLRSIQQIMTRQSQTKPSADFHNKYGNILLISGSVFCFVGYVFYITQMEIPWNLSPIGRVTPKEWNAK